MAPWDGVMDLYDKYELLFENLIIEHSNLFHCCFCKKTFGDWSSAFVHITNDMHRYFKDKSTRNLEDFNVELCPRLTYKVIVTEGLVALTLTILECTICCSRVAVVNALRHINGLLHTSKKSKFILKLTDHPVEGLTSSFRGIEANTATSESQKDDKNSRDSKEPASIEPEETSNSTESSEETKDDIENENHDGCQKTSFEKTIEIEANTATSESQNDNKNSRDSKEPASIESVEMCNSTESNEETKDDIEKENHEGCEKTSIEKTNAISSQIAKSSGFSNVAPVTHEGTKVTCNGDDDRWDPPVLTDLWIVDVNRHESRCIICKCRFSRDAVSKYIHATGELHDDSLRVHFCDDIVAQDDEGFDCQRCNMKLSNIDDLHRHVQRLSHINRSWAKENVASRQLPYEQASSSKQDENATESAEISSNWWIFQGDYNAFHCILCDRKGNSVTSMLAHIKSKMHTGVVKTWGIKSVVKLDGNRYRCLPCDVVIDERFPEGDVVRHVKSTHHRLSVVADRDRDAANRMTGKKDGVDGRGVPQLSSVNSEGIISRRKVLKKRSFVGECEMIFFSTSIVAKEDDGRFFCLLCECHVDFLPGRFDDHFLRQMHKGAVVKYHCLRISWTQNDEYRCGCCGIEIQGLAAVCSHVKESSHVNCSIENPLKTGNFDTGPKISAAVVKTDRQSTVASSTPTYACRHCNCRTSDRKNYYEHINGKKHQKAKLKKQALSA